MAERRIFERLVAVGVGLILLIVGGMSFDRAARGRFDFHHFFLDARYVWEHAGLNPNFDDPEPDRRRQLPFYLPVVPLALSPLTAFGRTAAAVVWSMAQVAALGISLYILWRWCMRSNAADPASSAWAVPVPAAPVAYARDRARLPAVGAFGATILLAVPAFLEAGKFNQLSYFVLALILGGVTAVECARPKTAGVLFGAAAVLKLLPAIFLVWLLLKRRWTAAITLVVVGLVLAFVPPLVVFGPQRTLEYHQQWWGYNVRGDSASGLLKADLPDHFIDRRNQSIPQVLARLTWSEHPFAAPIQPIQLEPQTCTWLAYGISGVLLAALMWATRRSWSGLAPQRRHAEAAVYAISMLVFSPLLRQYYLVWAVPALALLARMAVDETAPRAQRLGQVGLGVWALGMIVWIWPLARVLGAHLFMLLVLGVLLLCATRAVLSKQEEYGQVSARPSTALV